MKDYMCKDPYELSYQGTKGSERLIQSTSDVVRLKVVYLKSCSSF